MSALRKLLSFLLLLEIVFFAGQVQAESKSLMVAVQSLPPTVEPMGENTNRMARIMYSIFETLIRQDQHTGELKPGLAESWQRIDDRTVEFTLRQGVKFHDGSEFTAEDVVFSFGPERFSSEEAPGRVQALQFLGIVEKVEAIEPYKVRVITQTTDPLIENRFASRMSEIISKKSYLDVGSWERWSQKPVGTGPYKVLNFSLNTRLELGRFDGYWDEPAPVSTLAFIEVPELSSRIAGLRSGEFDIITEVAPDQLEALSRVSGIDVVGGPVENIYALVFDTLSNPVLNDPRIRRAILHAIDRQALVDALFGGRTKTANSWQFETYGDLFLPEFERPLYNPDLAKNLVKESGYKGEPIVWRFFTGYYTLELTVTQAIAQMLQEAGLNVKLEIMENWDRIQAPGPERMLNNASFTGYYQDPVGMLWRRMRPASPWRTGKFFDMPERFDQLGTILETTVAPNKRKEAFKEMLEIMNEDPTAVPLYFLPMFYAKRSNIDWQIGIKEFMDLSAQNLSFNQ